MMPTIGPRASSGNLSTKILDKRFNKMLFNMHGIPVRPNVSNQQQQQQQQQQQEDQPLVNKIAELKMIRALQIRVNKRTNRYARLLEDIDDEVGQATDVDLQRSLEDLSDREARIQEITRDIVLEKNQ